MIDVYLIIYAGTVAVFLAGVVVLLPLTFALLVVITIPATATAALTTPMIGDAALSGADNPADGSWFWLPEPYPRPFKTEPQPPPTVREN